MIAMRGASSLSPFPRERIIKREVTEKVKFKKMTVGYMEEIITIIEI